MDQVYQAKLSGSPPGQNNHQNQQEDIHITPFPNPHTQGQAQGNHTRHPAPIPVQLPNIYVTTPSPQAPHQATHSTHSTGTRREDHTPRMMHLGPFKFARPHPLLWVTLGLSLIALVLEVPKGSLPTLTGRHRQLRNQERLVQDRLHLLSRLSTFLPPPLASIIDPNTPNLSPSNPSLDLLKFWNANANAYTLNGVGQGYGHGQAERWWSVEELGEGASVVRSKGQGTEREVWVLRFGSDTQGNQAPLLNALTHSLLLRDRLLSDIASLKTQSSVALSTSPHSPVQQVSSDQAHFNDDDHHSREQHRDVREHERERRKRERERERQKEVEEREEEVGRREKWVIDEMRKLTDRVHAEASELTLEDRITERLKSYQRQLSKLAEDKEAVPVI